MKFNNVDFDTYFKNLSRRRGLFRQLWRLLYPARSVNRHERDQRSLPDHLQIPQVHQRASPHPQGVSGQTHADLPPCKTLRQDRYGRSALCQARGSEPHRRAQTQPLHGRGASLQSTWARRRSSPRPAQGSMALRWRPPPLTLAWTATSIRARWTSKKQAPNVARMKILGARVIEVTDGLQTLKESGRRGLRSLRNEYKGRYLLHRFRCRPLIPSR